MDELPGASRSYRGEFLSANGMRLFYEIMGDGPPLLLLHGYTFSGEMWSATAAELMHSYRLIIPDLRGHGRSTSPTNDFDHFQTALDLIELLDHLGIDHTGVIGYSYGGIVALHLAMYQPSRIRALIAIGASARMTDQHRAICTMMTPTHTSWDWSVLRQRHIGGDTQIQALLEQFHQWREFDGDALFPVENLAAITARTLLIHGDRDSFFPISTAVELYTSIPTAALWIIPNADHFCITDDHHAEFVRIAHQFLHHAWAAP